MLLFNSIQLTILLVAWPFIIGFLDKAEFRGSSAAFWSAIVMYGLQLIFTAYSYCETLEKK
jgi:hypothetical protein